MDVNTNVSEHVHAHEHAHPHEHKHTHQHDPAEKKKQVNRLSRVIGHLEHIKDMIERDENCSDVLMQLTAARSALNGLGKSIITEHLAHCIVHAIEDGDFAEIEEFQKSIQKYI